MTGPLMTVYEELGLAPKDCGLPAGSRLDTPDGPPLHPYRSPLPVLDCVLIRMPGDPGTEIADGPHMFGGVMHGTDCNISRAVAESYQRRDPAAFIPSCARMAAGGSFRVLAAEEMAR